MMEKDTSKINALLYTNLVERASQLILTAKVSTNDLYAYTSTFRWFVSNLLKNYQVFTKSEENLQLI